MIVPLPKLYNTLEYCFGCCVGSSDGDSVVLVLNLKSYKPRCLFGSWVYSPELRDVGEGDLT